MPDPTMPPTSHGIQNPEVRHERSDANANAVVVFGVVFVAALVLVHVLVWYLFVDFSTSQARQSAAPPAIASERPQFPRDLGRIPEPRLQVSDKLDMKALLERDAARLEKYGWADRKAGTVHVPIEVVLTRLAADPKAAAAVGLKLAPTKNKKGER